MALYSDTTTGGPTDKKWTSAAEYDAVAKQVIFEISNLKYSTSGLIIGSYNTAFPIIGNYISNAKTLEEVEYWDNISTTVAFQNAEILAQVENGTTATNNNLLEDTDVNGNTITATQGSNAVAGTGVNNETESNDSLDAEASDDNESNPGATVAGSTFTNIGLLQNNALDQGKTTLASASFGLQTGNTGENYKDTTTGTTNTPPKPGLRQYNPLSSFASYTYQLTLYMITPESYNAFILTQRKNIYARPDGVFLIAQSGGINNEVSQRAEGFDLDYYIDDLKITTATSGKSTLTSTNVTDVTFTIYEPYGFSFLSNLRRANLGLIAKSNLKGMSASDNPMKQFYILGLRFQGYDINGELITSDDFNSTDPANPFRGLAEKFYDIKIYDMKYRLDGKLSTYRISARSTAPSQAFGLSRGRVDHRLTVEADNVFQALVGPFGLLTKINEQQEQLATKEGPNGKTAIETPNVYKIQFIGNAETIANASLINQADLDKFRYPMSKIKKTDESNDSTALDSRPNPTQRTFTFDNSTPITMAINDIIKNSDYMANSLKVLYTEALEPSDDPDDPDQINNPNKATLNWYTLSSQIKPIAWDTTLNDWAYEITYIIEPYSIPNVLSPYSAKVPRYYGPHKRYEYWYTGKNTEVITFEQQLDNAYTMVALAPDGSTPAIKNSGASMKAGIRENESRTGSRDVGLEAQNSVLTSLFSPRDWAESKITIMGDPDYLIQDSSTANPTDVYNQFYGADGFTINANGGQVFIEIDFKEGIDYNNEKGTMDLNDAIAFWVDKNKLPADIKDKVNGIVYMVINVVSTFSKGKFTQELELRTMNFPQSDNADATAGEQRETDTANSGTRTNQGSQVNNNTTQSTTGATSNSDLLKDQNVDLGVSAEAQSAAASFNKFVANNPDIETIPWPSTLETTPVVGAEDVTTVAGTQYNPNSSNTTVILNTVVADDDGTIDYKNEVIVTSSTSITNTDAFREVNIEANIANSSSTINLSSQIANANVGNIALFGDIGP